MAMEKLHKIFMVSADGKANRTIELLAEDEDAAKAFVERQEEDAIAQRRTEAIDAKKAEFRAAHDGEEPDARAVEKIEASIPAEKPYKVKTVEAI